MPYEPQPYPRMLYKYDFTPRIVPDEAQEAAAATEGWVDHPDKALTAEPAPEPAPAPAPAPEPAASETDQPVADAGPVLPGRRSTAKAGKT